MYKCGWNGCEKAYGTLNHLNAHVTMQSHGQKRTPEGKLFHFISPPAVAPLPQIIFFFCPSIVRSWCDTTYVGLALVPRLWSGVVVLMQNVLFCCF
jgi:hypothetical protein